MTGPVRPVLMADTAGGGRRVTGNGRWAPMWTPPVVRRRQLPSVAHCPVAGPGRPLGEGIGPTGPGAPTALTGPRAPSLTGVVAEALAEAVAGAHRTAATRQASCCGIRPGTRPGIHPWTGR